MRSVRRWVSMSSGVERVDAAFREAGRPLFLPYVMGGYPDVATSTRYAAALAEHADIIELGIPFSDPLADGPTIQAAGQVALRAGTRPQDVLDMAAALRGGPPVAIMTYLNVVLAHGARVFMEQAVAADVAALIVPDLPIDESDEILTLADRLGIALVPFAAPTSSDDRLASVGRHARGFVYCVALTGVTGGSISVDATLRDYLTRARRAIDAPLAVGFGVRTPEEAAEVGRLADGVIIGGQLVRLIDEAPSAAAAEAALHRFAGDVRGALGG